MIYFADGGSSYNAYKLIDGEGQVIVQWTGNFNNSPTGYSGIYACEAYDPNICRKSLLNLTVNLDGDGHTALWMYTGQWKL